MLSKYNLFITYFVPHSALLTIEKNKNHILKTPPNNLRVDLFLVVSIYPTLRVQR